MKPFSVGVIIIGNEVLYGKIGETNLKMIINHLLPLGINVCEARCVMDTFGDISYAVNDMRFKYENVITTGGIGPTHDDITIEAISKAMNIEISENQEAIDELLEFLPKAKGKDPEYVKKLIKFLNKESDDDVYGYSKMINLPIGCEIIKNDISGAPGFSIGNVHVLAGVPKICDNMMINLLPRLRNGIITHGKKIRAYSFESKLVEILNSTNALFKSDVEIGSYPITRDGKSITEVVLRSKSQELMNKCMQNIIEGIDCEYERIDNIDEN
jgi:molybdopterin-biosynthesis enzyme MoeA-like protein